VNESDNELLRSVKERADSDEAKRNADEALRVFVPEQKASLTARDFGPDAPQEERPKFLLASINRQDRQQALVLIKGQYRQKLAPDFQERFPELSAQDFDACWERVFQQLARVVDKVPFDTNRSLHKSLLLMLLEEPLKGLLASGQDGDVRRGLSLVAELYEHPVQAVIGSRWPDLSNADRENVWQETFEGLLQKIKAGDFRRDGPLLGFLLGIVKHKVADHYRAKAALDKVLGTIGQSRSASTRIDPGQQLKAEEFRRLLRVGIDSLTPQEQLVVREYVEGFPETEKMPYLLERVKIANGEDKSLSAIRTTLSRGKKRLVTFLRSHGYSAEGGDA
jgi:DNA-directed RNA polymerase specialized sigma24 family protein